MGTIMGFDRITSDIDRSVNFVKKFGEGKLEARYVRRNEEYFIVYVSSQSGCRLACRFCHLTRTRQTTFDQADFRALREQVEVVLDYHDKNETPSGRMNLNFMARGEPLLNPIIAADNAEFFSFVKERAERSGVSDLRINLSTIFPLEAENVDLVSAFTGQPVTLFWSLYSLDPVFRKRWLPKTESPDAVFRKLAAYQSETGNPVVLHWALISGENDDDETFERIAKAVNSSGIDARLNLVRYNPADGGTGVEAPENRYAAALRILGQSMTVPGSRVVPRVGYDVKASCGMFVGANA